jgi:glycosyltransferase involved in cell wall biosynthesis
MKQKTLIFLSPYDPTNVMNWSGTLYALYKTLEKNDAGVRVRPISGGWLDELAQQFNRVMSFVGFKFDCRVSTYFAIIAGLLVSVRLIFIPKGPILAVAASNYAPYLITKRFIIYISDAPFRANAEIYPELKKFPRWLYRQFDRNEATILRRADVIILPSKWASDSAKTDYGVPAEKIYELPFGANIADEIIDEYYVPKRTVGPELNLLFVSADWKRKGGDKAVAICQALIKRGITARLTIIGDVPEDVRKLEFVVAKGFLKKSVHEQLISICRAYREAHFLVLPTVADASPIVFSECRAFGVPPITHIVGGTPSAIEHGVTGLLLHLDTLPDRFAEEIIRYVRDPALYEKLSRECRTWYVERAHWSNWGKLILKLANLDGPRP